MPGATPFACKVLVFLVSASSPFPCKGRACPALSPLVTRQFQSALESGFGRCCRLRAHLLHELPHRGGVTRVAALRPRFISLRRLFQVGKDLFVGKTLAERRNDGFHRFPHSEELAAGLKEKVLVQ